MWTVLTAAALTWAGTMDPPSAPQDIEQAYDTPRIRASLMTMDGVFPGVRGGVELPLVVGVRDRKLKRKDFRKNGIGEIVVAPTLGTWVEPRNASHVFFGAEAGLRWTKHRGLRIGWHLGANYLHAFNGGATYNATEPGQIRRAPLAGSPGFMPTTAFELGVDWGKRKNHPLSIDFRPGFWAQVPFNDGWLFGLSTELCVTWRLGVR